MAAVADNVPAVASSSSANVTATGESVLVEGRARIPYTGDEGVFYNKVQVFNRDLSIAIITEFTRTRANEVSAREQRAVERRRRHEEKKDATTTQIDEEQADEHADDNNDGDDETKESSMSLTSPSSSSSQPRSVSSKSQATYLQGSQSRSIRILEALSATGLRSIRYFLEIPNVESILVNDFDATAVTEIKKNILFNNLNLSQLIPSKSDAKILMYNSINIEKQFDVIDLDPYGSAIEFLDGAVQSVSDGGLLAVTCTDKAVLCGSYSETCYAKYGAISLRGKNCYEMAIRIVLTALQSAATKYKRHIIPIASMSIDFYVRVFVRVHTSQLAAKHSASQMALVYQCDGCETWHLQHMGVVKNHNTDTNKAKFSHAEGPPCSRLCDVCNSKFHVGGPIYAGPLHDSAFVSRVIADVSSRTQDFTMSTRIIGMLTAVSEELTTPFYWSLANLCLKLHIPQPKITLIRSALMNAGYHISQSHAHPDAIKTNAPYHILWDIMRNYIIQNKIILTNKHELDLVSKYILSIQPKFIADFTLVDGSDLSVRVTGVPKFLPNPEENWGPKRRASKKRSTTDNDTNTSESGKRAKGNARRKATNALKYCPTLALGRVCKFGDSCKYSHVMEMNDTTTMNNTTSVSDNNEQKLDNDASASATTVDGGGAMDIQ